MWHRLRTPMTINCSVSVLFTPSSLCELTSETRYRCSVIFFDFNPFSLSNAVPMHVCNSALKVSEARPTTVPQTEGQCRAGGPLHRGLLGILESSYFLRVGKILYDVRLYQNDFFFLERASALVLITHRSGTSRPSRRPPTSFVIPHTKIVIDH